ncbi:TolC family protein [Clostridium sp. A1-XYC3]|uniref:TolC family protein n=1 Tax=Clostridium tanneri TaxID=3037988 RepID=A0ABU4JWP4_9CLOT|nr:TolC family protein [Clostridium sp. A1-XYC3]MDW8802584.1 TolC family protein [Clostridium sp. A1-XYC3]
MKRIKLLTTAAVIIAALSSNTVFAQDNNTLDIDAVIDSAIESSYTVKSKDIVVQQAENNYKSAMENAPKVNDQINNTPLLTDNKKFELIKSRDNGPAEAKYSIYQSKNAKEVAKNEVKLSIYSQYTVLMDAKDVLDTEQKRLDNSEAEYKKAKLQLETGMITQNDLKAKEYAYYSQLAAFNKAKRQYEIETMNLNKLIGAPIETRYTTLLKDKITEDPYIRRYDSYLEDALKNRAEMLNASEYVNLMDFEFKTVKAFYPDTRDAEYKIGKYYVDSAKNTLETGKINISLEVNALYNDLQNKSKKLKSVKDSADYAKQDYDKALQKYKLGLISKIEADSKLITLQNAQNSVKALQRDIWIAQIKLGYACEIGASSTSLGQ